MALTDTHFKWMAFVGCTFIMVTLGTVYTIGNMTPYFTSYMRWKFNDDSIRSTSSTWASSLTALGQSIAMPLSGYIERRLGIRVASLIGCAVFTLSVALSGFALDWSFYAFLACYGFMFGLGLGISYTLCIGCSIKWFPKKKGTISGFSMLGYGLSSFVFNMIQTAIINPDNLSQDHTDYSGVVPESYFTQPELLERVPLCFFIMAGIFAVMQLIGLILINTPVETVSVDEDRQALFRQSVNDDGQNAPAYGSINSSVSSTTSSSSSSSSTADVKPGEVLRSKNFYLIYFIFFGTFISNSFFSSQYKSFGRTFISSDFYLTLVGSLWSVFNAFGRIGWGYVTDKTSNRFALFTNCCLSAVLLFSLYSVTIMPPIFYLIWVCLSFFTISGQFAITSATMAKLYGQKYFATNYGLLFTSGFVASTLTALLATFLQPIIGWYGAFNVCAGTYVVSAILAFLFRAKTADGQEV